MEPKLEFLFNECVDDKVNMTIQEEDSWYWKFYFRLLKGNANVGNAEQENDFRRGF